MKQKIRSVFHVLLPCLLTLVLVVSFFTFQKDLVEVMQKKAYLSLSEIAMEHKYYFHCRLEGEWNILKTLSASIPRDEPRNDEQIFAMMGRLVTITGFQCFSIVENDGRRRSNHGYVDNISNSDYFKDIMEGKPVISEPTTSLVDGRKNEVILITYPVIENDKVIYTLMGAYEVNELSTVLFSSSYRGESYSTIIDKDGNVILTDEHRNRLANQSNIYEFYKTVMFHKPYSLSKLQEEIKNGKQGSFSYEYDGNYRMGYYQAAEINGWAILSVMPSVVVNDNTVSIAATVNRLIYTVTCIFLILLLWIFLKTKAERQRLKAKAEKDGMTGILNKAAAQKQMELVLKVTDGKRHALFILDIDNFKGINDTWGHAAGDEVITGVASILKDVFRSDDILGRIGGDEFAVLFKNVKEDADLYRKANEMILAFQAMEMHVNRPVSCSIGISVSNGNGVPFAKLYKEADQALYQAKEQGKSQYAFYKQER